MLWLRYEIHYLMQKVLKCDGTHAVNFLSNLVEIQKSLIHSLTKVKILKSRGRFGKFLWCYGPRLCFFCAAEKPEKPRKMYSTKLFTFSEVSLAFPRHRKNKVEARNTIKTWQKSAKILKKFSLELEIVFFYQISTFFIR